MDDSKYYEYSVDGDKIDRRNNIIRELSTTINRRASEDDHDKELRDNNPGLQELWDQYQTMKELLK